MATWLKKVGSYVVNKLSNTLEFVKFVFIPKNKILFGVLLLLVFVSIFFAGKSVFAQPFSMPSSNDVIHLFNRVLFLIAYALGWIVSKLFALVVIISSYNDFVTSDAVTKGWTLTRDIANMFFVIILLVIAFGNILGVQKYEMKKWLPKVLKVAILVNFSKLICGLIIDGGQVVMMTFVNGYQATAGANLTVGLGLTKMMKMNEAAGGIDNPEQVTVAITLGILMLTLTFFVVFFIAVLFLIRIVVLWILVVLSPLAFLASSLPQTESYYNKWWDRFGKYVAVGPLMAFFLWLSLLVMSNPDQMNKKMGDDIEAAGGGTLPISEAGTYDSIVQFAIGISMLMGSLMVATEVGGVIGAQAGKMQGAIKSGSKAVAGFAARTAARPVTMPAKAVGRRAAAVYGGYKAKAKLKDDTKMAYWAGGGEKIFAGKEDVVGNIKKAGQSGLEFGKDMKGYLGAAGTTRGSAGDRIAAGRAAVENRRSESRHNIKMAGSSNAVTVAAITAGQNKKRLEAATERVKNAKLSTAEQRQMMTENLGSKDDRKAVALNLANKSRFENLGQVANARQALAGDEEALKTFNKSVNERQAHLSVDWGAAARGGPENQAAVTQRADFIRAVQHEELNISKQSPEFYQNGDAMAAAFEALGAKAFGEKLKNVPDRGDNYSASIATGIGEAMQQIIPGLADNVATAGSPDERRTAERELETVRGAAFNMTSGDAAVAFGARDAAGAVVDVAPADGTAGDLIAAARHLNNANSKTLAKVEISDAFAGQIAHLITPNKITAMAKNGEGRSNENVSALLTQLVEYSRNPGTVPVGGDITVINNTLARMAGSAPVMNSVSREIRTRIQTLTTPPPPPPPDPEPEPERPRSGADDIDLPEGDGPPLDI